MKTKFTPPPWLLEVLRAIGTALLVAILEALGFDVDIQPKLGDTNEPDRRARQAKVAAKSRKEL